MSKTVKIANFNSFANNIKKESKRVQVECDKEIQKSALRIEKRSKKFAAWDTGWMSNNIFSSSISFLKWEVVSPVAYSIYIEKGTRKMMAQPFLAPAVKADVIILMKNIAKILGG